MPQPASAQPLTLASMGAHVQPHLQGEWRAQACSVSGRGWLFVTKFPRMMPAKRPPMESLLDRAAGLGADGVEARCAAG